jgi:hypothetical protein
MKYGDRQERDKTECGVHLPRWYDTETVGTLSSQFNAVATLLAPIYRALRCFFLEILGMVDYRTHKAWNQTLRPQGYL